MAWKYSCWLDHIRLSEVSMPFSQICTLLLTCSGILKLLGHGESRLLCKQVYPRLLWCSSFSSPNHRVGSSPTTDERKLLLFSLSTTVRVMNTHLSFSSSTMRLSSKWHLPATRTHGGTSESWSTPEQRDTGCIWSSECLSLDSGRETMLSATSW